MRFKVTASEGQTSTRCLMVPKGTVGSYVPSKFLIEDSQGNCGHFFGSEMRSHEVVHNPMDIQCSLKSLLIFCVGVGFPPEC